MKKLILLLLACSFAFCSCEDLLSNLLGDKIELEENVDNGDGSGVTDNGGDNSAAELSVTEFKSEQEMETAVKDIYASLYEYMRLQKAIEKSIIVDKDFGSVTSTNPDYEQTWNAAYKTIDKGNLYIRSLERAFESYDQQIVEKYLASCHILVGFTYKNLFEHWGNVPIITSETPIDAMLMTSPEDEVLQYAIELLERSHFVFEQGNHSESSYISYEASLLASAEVYGYRDYNKGLEFSKRVVEQNSEKEIIYELTGHSDNIVIYTSGHAELYCSEFSYILGRMEESGITDFNELLKKWNPESYGYWSMLKRNKRFTEQVGCPEYMQNLPVPQNILNNNPGVMQNPGY